MQFSFVANVYLTLYLIQSLYIKGPLRIIWKLVNILNDNIRNLSTVAII